MYLDCQQPLGNLRNSHGMIQQLCGFFMTGDIMLAMRAFARLPSDVNQSSKGLGKFALSFSRLTNMGLLSGVVAHT